MNKDITESIHSEKLTKIMNFGPPFLGISILILLASGCAIGYLIKNDMDSPRTLISNFLFAKTGSDLNQWESGLKSLNKSMSTTVEQLRASDDAKARKFLQQLIEYDNTGKKWGKNLCREAFRYKRMLEDQGARDFLTRMIEGSCY